MLDITQRGITALKAGDRPAARKFLSQAVKEKPDDPIAWLWLSGAVENDDHRIVCLRQVLRIDPQNQAAVRGLEKLLSKTQQPPPVQTQETVEAPEPPVIDKAGPQIFEPPPSPEPVAALQPQPIEPIQPEKNFEPAWRTKALAAREEMPPQRIFRIRPSLVPALACFWLFFIGAILL
ncbi:MAG: hypothetical protein IH586_13985, partial [Anaerolineaceae bacterium]|nr:hypothetical protein [Anaerolineaceae bacterium]